MSTVSNFIITTDDGWTFDEDEIVAALWEVVVAAGHAANGGNHGLGRPWKASDAADAKQGPRVIEQDVWLAASNCFAWEELVELLEVLPVDHLARRVVVFACDQGEGPYHQIWPRQ